MVTGHDYSWPQCPKGVGNGQGAPLPPGQHAFAVVGITNGAGLHENPCLASMWSYARAHASWVTGYTMLTYPTSSQLRAVATGHYGSCSTLACKLRNSGWAQGDFADQSLRNVGARPPLVWVDVETRKHQPWSSSRARNSLVIKAAIASLQAHGYGVGIYSNRSLWSRLAGFRTRLPEWVPSGSLTAGCRLSFAGGRVLLSQRTKRYPSGHVYDENGRCARTPTVTGWWQRAHPTVTVFHDGGGGLSARFDGRAAFSLMLQTPSQPSVTAAPSTAGAVPLFVVADATGQLQARTMSSPWTAIGSQPCADTPALAVSSSTLTVTCTGTDGSHLVTTVPLGANAAPAGPGTTTVADGSSYGGQSAPRASTSATLR